MLHTHCLQITRKTRLRAVILISFCFFIAEISVGFYTRSIALIADAFHYLNDLISFIVALTAVHVTSLPTSPENLTYGWARAQLLGAFFNGAFLLALGLSIALQSIERFIRIERVENPKLVLIVGCVGLGLNLLSALFVHEHDHGNGYGDDVEDADAGAMAMAQGSHAMHKHVDAGTVPPSRRPATDLGMLGVLVHIIGDALNNIGVIISALIIWLLPSGNELRYYADPSVSLWIAVMILLSAVPLTLRSGKILLQSSPQGVSTAHIKHDLEALPGVRSVHELHVWRLDQNKAVATAHVVVDGATSVGEFVEKARIAGECLHAYGIHSATLQPEVAREGDKCGVPCGTVCEGLKCCQ